MRLVTRRATAPVRPRLHTTVALAPLDPEAVRTRRAAFFDALLEACEQASTATGTADRTVAA